MSRYFGTIRQLGYVVDDLDTALRHWTEVLGAGPFWRVERLRPPDFSHRGVPSAAEVTAALGHLGEMQIELVQPLDREPSAFREFIDAGHRGLHHFAYWFDSADAMNAALAKAASLHYEIMLSGTYGGGRTVFLDVERDQPGTVIELSEVCGFKADLFRMIAAAACDWDGSEPVRLLVPPPMPSAAT